MRLILTAAGIAIKRGAYIILCAALGFLLPAAVIPEVISGQPDVRPVTLAIVNEDESPLLLPIIGSMLSERLDGLLTVDIVDSPEAAEGFAAVLTLPNGFFESVMTGENLSPSLSVNVSSPLEGAWVSCLAQSGGRLLSTAQAVVGAVNSAMVADGLSPGQRERLILSIDAALLNDYLSRSGRFESVMLYSTGSIPAAEYYLASGVSFVLFLLSFLLFSPLFELKRFGAAAQRPVHCFWAAVLCCAAFSLILSAAGLIVMGCPPDRLLSGGFWGAAALLCGVMLLIPSITGSPASCAALSAGLTLAQAVFGGAILPEALLPLPLARIAPLAPLSLLRRLLAAAAFDCGFEGVLPLLLWCAALPAISFAAWRFGLRGAKR